MLNFARTAALTMALSTPAAQAFAGNWFAGNSCQMLGGLLGQCQLPGITSATNFYYSKYKDGVFHARFDVSYSYKCDGHEIELGLFNGNNFVKFQRGPDKKIASIEEFGSISIGDRNPIFTKNLALFQPGCTFELLKVSVMPSIQTLQQLATEAQYQAKVLTYADTMFRLGVSWTNLSTWTSSELDGIKDELSILRDVSANPQDIDMLITVVDLAKNNQPLPLGLGQTGNNLAEFKAYLQAKLAGEIQAAADLLDAYEEFSVTAPAPLSDAFAEASEHAL